MRWIFAQKNAFKSYIFAVVCVYFRFGKRTVAM